MGQVLQWSGTDVTFLESGGAVFKDGGVAEDVPSILAYHNVPALGCCILTVVILGYTIP